MRDRFRSRLLAVASAAAGLAVLAGSGAASASVAAHPAASADGWKIQSTYAPGRASSKDTAAEEVSCSAANACLAIGSAGGTNFLYETWNGTKWTARVNAFPAGGDLLSDVSCSGGGRVHRGRLRVRQWHD